MKLTKIANDFAPRNKALYFGITTELEEPCDIEVEVVDADFDSTIARQLLREITSVKVNIAPYTKPFTEYVPSLHPETSIEEAPTASYTIRVEGIEAEPIRLSVNSQEQMAPSLVSTMPLKRTIAYGERDELLLIAHTNDNLAIVIKSDTGEELSLHHTTSTGAAILSLSTEDFDNDIRSLYVEISCNEHSVSLLHYNVVSAHKSDVRLAWISSRGSIERYTFPVTANRQRKAEKQTIRTRDGVGVVSSSTERRQTLVSRFEPRDTIDALADIISATRVWIEEKGGFREVEVCSSVIDGNLFSEPDCVAIELIDGHREEVVL